MAVGVIGVVAAVAVVSGVVNVLAVMVAKLLLIGGCCWWWHPLDVANLLFIGRGVRQKPIVVGSVATAVLAVAKLQLIKKQANCCS